MDIFSLFFFFSFFFLALYLIIYILGIIIDHIPTKKITRNRKRPKKIFINSTITREVFNGQYRKELEIPLFIDCYNYYINSVDVTNQLRVIIIIYFSRNEKEFFLGIFWVIDIILTDY
jgi:hypothetical protein